MDHSLVFSVCMSPNSYIIHLKTCMLCYCPVYSLTNVFSSLKHYPLEICFTNIHSHLYFSQTINIYILALINIIILALVKDELENNGTHYNSVLELAKCNFHSKDMWSIISYKSHHLQLHWQIGKNVLRVLSRCKLQTYYIYNK